MKVSENTFKKCQPDQISVVRQSGTETTEFLKKGNNMKKILSALFVAASLLAGTAFAQPVHAPGKPSHVVTHPGVHKHVVKKHRHHVKKHHAHKRHHAKRHGPRHNVPHQGPRH